MQMQPPAPNESGTPYKKPNYSWVWILVAVLGVCGCGGVLILAAILFPVFSQARLAAARAACMSNVKQCSLALLMYTADNDDHFPLAGKWIDRSEQYAKNDPFTCPALLRSKGRYGYAMSSLLSEKSGPDIRNPDRAILLF